VFWIINILYCAYQILELGIKVFLYRQPCVGDSLVEECI